MCCAFQLQNKHSKNESGEKTGVRKASDHSGVDMFAQALQFMSIDEVIKITLLS